MSKYIQNYPPQILKSVVTLVVRKESSGKGSKDSIFISDLIKYKALLNISYQASL